jgi:hypothetical protein
MVQLFILLSFCKDRSLIVVAIFILSSILISEGFFFRFDLYVILLRLWFEASFIGVFSRELAAFAIAQASAIACFNVSESAEPTEAKPCAR